MALVTGAGCGALVVLIAFAIRTDMLAEIDRRVLNAVQRRLPEPGSKGARKAATAMRDLTALGGDLLSVLVLCAGTALLLGQGRPSSLIQFYGLMLGARLMGFCLKKAIRRTRPQLSPGTIDVFTSSFPSVHTTMSFATSFSIAIILVSSSPLGLPPALAFSAAVSALVGMTRLYFAVHWPSDVLAGWILGLSVCLVAVNFS